MLTDEQLAIRRTGVSGSDIAAVAGLDPYRGPFDVYLDKKGLRESEGDTFATERGRFMEPAIIAWYEHRTGRVVSNPGTLRHPEFPHIIATPDGESVLGDDRRALECKSPGPFTAKRWGEAGTDEIDEGYVPQVMWECAVLGVSLADVVAYVGGDIKIYHVPFNQMLFDALRGIAEKFIRDHIEADNPPKPDGSERARKWLQQRYPQAVHDVMEASAEIELLARQYDAARTAETEAAKLKSVYKNQLAALLQDHEGAKGHGISITYRNNKEMTKLDHEALLAELAPPPELIAKYTKTIPGPRVLRVTVKE